MSAWRIATPVIFVLASGTYSGIANKVLYNYKSEGACGYQGFEKPFFLTLCMFLGESLCLLLHFASEWYRLDSSKLWLSRCCGGRLSSFDVDLAQRRREREREALTHGIEPYDAGARSSRRHNGASEYNAPGEFSSGSEDDGLDRVDEEQSLLSSAALASAPSAAASPSLHRSLSRIPSDQLDQDLLDLRLSEAEVSRRLAEGKPSKLVYLLLSSFDLAATAVGGVGLQYIDASSNQMLRGSGVVFTAILSVALLGRRMGGRQWGAVLLVVLGLVLVGLCGLFRAHRISLLVSASEHNKVSPSGALLGLVLVLLGSLLNAVQNVLEESLVKRAGGSSVHALEIVGWEGLWGTGLSSLVLLAVNYLPGSNCGRVESWTDTVLVVTRSSMVACLVLGYTLALAMLNAFSVQLSKEVSATFRQLVNALRVVFIWLIMVLMFYWWTQRSMGEGIDVYSLIQLGGFALLILGTLLYGTRESEDRPGAFAPVIAVDPPEEDGDDAQPEEDALDDGDADDVLRYDEDGNKLAAKQSKAKHEKPPRHHSKHPHSRSPGVETVALPDVRDTCTPTSNSGSASSSTLAPRRAQAGIRIDEPEAL